MSRRDSEWIVSIFDDHYSAIYVFLARRVGSTFADDLSSEVFSIALARSHTFDPQKGSAVGWLFGIASNLINSHRRAEDRRLRAYARDQRATSPLVIYEELMEVESLDESQNLANALTKLSTKYRDVLLMSAWTDLSQEQIAEALRIPVGTVKSRLSRAREEMRELLARIDKEPASTNGRN